MSVAAVYRLLPGAPSHERPRLLELATAARDGEVGTFGEPARQALGVAVDRVRAEMRGGELTECLAVLGHLRSNIGALRPSELAKRRGLAGVFDSRKRRLKRFRDAFAQSTRTLSESLDDLQVRRGALERRSGFAEQLWSGLRNAVLETDAHALAAAVAAGDAAEAPLTARALALAGARDAAIRVLPQTRVGQNADAEAAARIRAVCDTLMEWHIEWRAALGMDRQDRRGRTRAPSERLKPDQNRLNAARDTTLAMIETTARELEFARQRRLDADVRIEAARREI